MANKNFKIVNFFLQRFLTLLLCCFLNSDNIYIRTWHHKNIRFNIFDLFIKNFFGVLLSSVIKHD